MFLSSALVRSLKKTVTLQLAQRLRNSRKASIMLFIAQERAISLRLKIKDFENLTGVRKTALRFYDREGLLYPQRSEDNNYRFYSEKDLIRLVQLRQLSAFGIPLNLQSASGRTTGLDHVLSLLEKREQEIGKAIEDLYELLARIRLHENEYRKDTSDATPATIQHMIGAYRLMLSDPDVLEHPDTPSIVARWMDYAPYTYTVLSISKNDLRRHDVEYYPVRIGVGLLKKYFDLKGETLRPPIHYSPPNRCVARTVEVEDLHRITPEHLKPLLDCLNENHFIPLDDLYGWISYASVDEEKPCYHVSMRVAIA